MRVRSLFPLNELKRFNYVLRAKQMQIAILTMKRKVGKLQRTLWRWGFRGESHSNGLLGTMLKVLPVRRTVEVSQNPEFPLTRRASQNLA